MVGAQCCCVPLWPFEGLWWWEASSSAHLPSTKFEAIQNTEQLLPPTCHHFVLLAPFVPPSGTERPYRWTKFSLQPVFQFIPIPSSSCQLACFLQLQINLSLNGSISYIAFYVQYGGVTCNSLLPLAGRMRSSAIHSSQRGTLFQGQCGCFMSWRHVAGRCSE